jgi:hypothetical protein
MTPDEMDQLINPPLIGIHPDNLKYRGPIDIRPGMIAYAWPQFPFPILTPRQRTILGYWRRIMRYASPLR